MQRFQVCRKADMVTMESTSLCKEMASALIGALDTSHSLQVTQYVTKIIKCIILLCLLHLIDPTKPGHGDETKRYSYELPRQQDNDYINTVTGKPCSNRGPSQQPSHESCGSAPPAGATSRGSCTDMSSKLSFGSEAVLLAGVSSVECIGLALAEAGGFFPNPNIVLV
nr:hypothetical protein Iba_chr08cCG12350 [Ipomoea batatas]